MFKKTGLFVSIVILIIVSYFIFLDNSSYNDNEQYKIIRLHVDNCNAQKQACSVDSNDLKIRISFDENIFYLKPFYISVIDESNVRSKIESIQIEFKMKNMDMGINRFLLEKINNENDKGFWKGKALLPICVAGRADWVSELNVRTKKYNYIISLPIEVKK